MSRGPSKTLFVAAGIASLAIVVVAVLLVREGRKNLGSREAQSCREELADDDTAAPAPPAPPLTIGGAPLPPTLLGRAVHGEPTVIETGPARFAEVARRYQPTVRVASVDRFWPVSLPTALELRRRGRGTRFVPKGSEPRDARLADLTPGGSVDDYLDHPVRIDEVQEQFCSVANALGLPPAAPGDERTALERLDPYGSAQLYAYATREASYEQKDIPERVISLQYWFYFPFNYLPTVRFGRGRVLEDPLAATVANFGLHEGDFEHVAVLFDPERGWPDRPPLGLWMARHEREEGRFFPWGSDEVQWQGEHPVVYPGLGSHASYNRCGRQARSRAQERFTYLPDDHVLCRPEQLLTFDAVTTPLVDLRSLGWPCFEGHLGEVPQGRIAEAERRIFKLGAGPRAPLQQAENARICS